MHMLWSVLSGIIFLGFCCSFPIYGVFSGKNEEQASVYKLTAELSLMITNGGLILIRGTKNGSFVFLKSLGLLLTQY